MAQNNPYTDNPYLNNPDTDSPYPTQFKPAVAKKADSVYTQRLKEHFSFFGIGSALYAIFYTFCLYKNASGITYPFFVAGTLCYFFFSMHQHCPVGDIQLPH